MKEILDFIFCNDLQVPVIAVITVMLTGILKMPVKRIAAKLKNGRKLTKYITFMPFVTGFGATVLVVFLNCGEVNFGNEFFVCWLSAVSLSLAVYAFWEKFVPTEKKILTQAEINENKILIEELKTALTENVKELPLTSETAVESSEEVETESRKRIILKNNTKGE